MSKVAYSKDDFIGHIAPQVVEAKSENRMPEFPKDKSPMEMLTGFMKQAEHMASYAYKCDQEVHDLHEKLANAKKRAELAHAEVNRIADTICNYAGDRTLFWAFIVEVMR